MLRDTGKATTRYRQATLADAAAMARLRCVEDPDYGFGPQKLAARMSGYLQGTHHPQHALLPRVVYVAEANGAIAGYAAGHLTTRHGCQAELEWMYVAPRYRRSGVASELARMLGRWFIEHNARHVCVNVAAQNLPARKFYARLGAKDLKRHWMVWKDVGVVAGSS